VLQYGGKIGGGGEGRGGEEEEEGGNNSATPQNNLLISDFCNNKARRRGQICKPNHVTRLFCFLNLTVFPQQL
jgi:hypothetical protein